MNKDEDMKKFNDDHIRRMVFASSSHESSDNPESDAASDDENQKKVNLKDTAVKICHITYIKLDQYILKNLFVIFFPRLIHNIASCLLLRQIGIQFLT